MRINIKPLSVNQAFCGRKFKTKKYIYYENEVLYSLQRYDFDFTNTKLTLDIKIGLSSKLADLDNTAKLMIDILAKKYGFNDRMIYKIKMEKEIVKKGEEYFDFEFFKYEKE